MKSPVPKSKGLPLIPPHVLMGAPHSPALPAFLDGESERAEVVIENFELRDPPAAAQELPELPPAYVMVVHSGPAWEREELLTYAHEVCQAEGVGDQIVTVDVYPATILAQRATRIFTAGGFNAMRQFGREARHRPLPFDRRFDDQYARVARMQKEKGSVVGPVIVRS